MEKFRNVVPLQIRFNDVDKFGHVNNTIYFQFYDSGKTDYVSTVCKSFDWNQYAIFVVKIEWTKTGKYDGFFLILLFAYCPPKFRLFALGNV